MQLWLFPSPSDSLSWPFPPSKQRLVDGFPITTGTEGLGWLPHVNARAQAMIISSTERRGHDGGSKEKGD